MVNFLRRQLQEDLVLDRARANRARNPGEASFSTLWAPDGPCGFGEDFFKPPALAATKGPAILAGVVVRMSIVITGAIVLGVIGLLVLVFSPQQKQLDYKVDVRSAVSDDHFERVLSELMGPPFLTGNRIRTLRNGDEIFPAMLDAIAGAERTITFESYIYWSGEIGSRFARALSDKAREGVAVHVLLDWAGSDKIDDEYLRLMKEGGVEIERYHEPHWYNLPRMNNRTHRKILVVDGRIGFTGGVGIADEWRGNGLSPDQWRDTHYRVEGPVVAQMQAAFLDNWMKVRPEIRQSPAYFPALEPVATGRGAVAQMFKSSSREGSSSVHIMYLLAIAAARSSIRLESAYFVPDRVAVRELIEARRRGVDVEIIVPGELTDSDVVRHASRSSWGELLAAGVRFYEYQPAKFHCKVLVVDDLFVSVGSTNFDERSFSLNDEANLNVLDADFAREQSRIFAEDKNRSREVTLEAWKKRPWQDRVAERLSSLIRAQL